MKILILDLTHGGDILTEILASKDNNVTCVDVYHIATEENKNDLRSFGAIVTDTVPQESYDLLISPAHCPDVFLGKATYEKRWTFSKAVEELIEDDRLRIEITGVKGKTSSCYLLAHILSTAGKKVFLHTSRGQGPWIDGKHIIEKKMSIAPTSLLKLPDGEFDCIVAEVSLGGSGKADIAAITNLPEDYGIAGNTRKASDAKAEIFTDNINIVREDELEIWKKYGELNFVTYGDKIEIISKPALGKPTTIGFHYSVNGYTTHHFVDLQYDYLAIQYIKSIDLVLKICESMEIPLWAVINGLRTFHGVPGRGEIKVVDGLWHICDRNPGISHLSIGMTLNCLKEMNALDNAVAIIDPVSKKVCDKMNVDSMKSVASEYGVPILITDGSGHRPEVPDGTKTIIEFIKEGFQ